MGRTETVRPVSKDSCAFVRAMQDPSARNEDREALLRKAVDEHVRRYRMAMSGEVRTVVSFLFFLRLASCVVLRCADIDCWAGRGPAPVLPVRVGHLDVRCRARARVSAAGQGRAVGPVHIADAGAADPALGPQGQPRQGHRIE